MKLFFKDQAFSFELLSAASYAGYQGTSLSKNHSQISGGNANERNKNRDTN